jgi:hypothetical protein
MSLRIPYYRPVGRPKYSGFDAGRIGSEAIDVSPITDALYQLADLWTGQLEQDRQQKQKLAISSASLATTRLAFGIADPSSPDFVSDPAARPDAFLKGKNAIRDGYLKQLEEEGVGGGDAFVLQFEQSALSDEFTLRKASAIALNQKNEAALETHLDEATRMAGEGSAEQQQQFRDLGVRAIEDAVRGGILSPVEAVKRERAFRSDIVVTRVRRDIMADPHSAERILSAGGYEDLTPEQRQYQLERATSAAESVERRQEVAANRAERLSERSRREYAEALQKEGDFLAANGKLTPSWIEQHRDDLDGTDYRHFYDELDPSKASTSVKTTPELYAGLRLRASNGEPIKDEARAAYTAKLITRDDFDRLVGEDEKGPKRPSWAQQGEDYIKTTLRVSDISWSREGLNKLANTLDAWNLWLEQHPDASPDEGRKVYRQMVQEAGGQAFQAAVQASPLANAVTRPADLDKAEDALFDEFLAKHGGDEAKMVADPDFVRRSTEIDRLRRAAPPTEEAESGRR